MTLDCLVADHAAASVPWHVIEEINHRVANDYAHAIAILTMAARRSTNAEARDALLIASERLHAFAEAHRAIALSSSTDRHGCSTKVQRGPIPPTDSAKPPCSTILVKDGFGR